MNMMDNTTKISTNKVKMFIHLESLLDEQDYLDHPLLIMK